MVISNDDGSACVTGSSLVGVAEHGEGKVKNGDGDQYPAQLPGIAECDIKADQTYNEKKERTENKLGVAPLSVVFNRHNNLLILFRVGMMGQWYHILEPVSIAYDCAMIVLKNVHDCDLFRFVDFFGTAMYNLTKSVGKGGVYCLRMIRNHIILIW